MLENSLDELRKSFDESFSVAPKLNQGRYEKALLFHLAQESYAVPLNHIQEVLNIPHITRVPGAPRIILGIINLKGVIVSVTCVHHLLELPVPEKTSRSRLLITKNLPFTTAFLVDRVQSVVNLREDQVQPPLSTLSSNKSEFIKGEFYTGEKLSILLDMERLMSSPQLQVH